MKKLYLVKKDPAQPATCDNWIVMNAYEFAMFMKTPEGQSRKSNFGPLDACSYDDYQIIGECGKECAKKWRSEKDRHDYLKCLEKQSEITTFSYNAIEVNDEELTGEELLADEDCDVEEIVLKRLQYEELYKAIEQLGQNDRLLIGCLFLQKNPMTSVEFGKMYGYSPQLVKYYKFRALDRLKKLLEK